MGGKGGRGVVGWLAGEREGEMCPLNVQLRVRAAAATTESAYTTTLRQSRGERASPLGMVGHAPVAVFEINTAAESAA